jgi:hypothetical protein
MSQDILALQAKYGAAVFNAKRYEVEAATLLDRINEVAKAEANVACSGEYPNPAMPTSALKEQSQKPPYVGLSTEQLSEVRRGGRYYGLYPRVGKKINYSLDSLRAIAKGRFRGKNNALDLLLAEIAIMDAEPAPERQSQKSLYVGLSPEQCSKVKCGGRYYGLYARVAAKLGRTSSHVGRVARGYRRDDTALQSLRAEMAIMDAEPASPKLLPPSMAQLESMRCGGRYYGCMGRAAHAAGLSLVSISNAAHGKAKSQRALTALYAEMARIDRELEASK